MPTYAYTCTSCGRSLEVKQSFSDPALTECPECSGRLRKVFSNVGVVFKGSGFYRTDSRASADGGSTAGDGAKPGKDGGSSGGDTGASSSGAGSSSSSAGSGSGGSGGSGSGGSSSSSASAPAGKGAAAS